MYPKNTCSNRHLNQSGINVVDLMMWLVIAALLLSTAIQSIASYQKSAAVQVMKSDLSGVSSLVMSTASMHNGEVTLEVAREAADSAEWSDGVVYTVGDAGDGRMPYIRASHPSLSDTDALYLFEECSDKYVVGINMVPKERDAVLEACGIFSSPEYGGPVRDGAPVMVSYWNTSLPGCSTITLPINGTINATANWGDGSTSTLTTTNRSHSYGSSLGTKRISIIGTFTGWGATSGWSSTCLVEVTGWGQTGTTNLSSGFYGATNLTRVAQIPSGVTNLNSVLRETLNFNSDISNWDTSKVTNMSSAFFNAQKFNRDISKWDTSNVTTMNTMFRRASSFNKDLSEWDTSKVTDMGAMFQTAYAFNKNLNGWDTSNVVNMSAMFRDALVFNGNVSEWNTSKVTNFNSMFVSANFFNQDLTNWNTSSATNMGSMFSSADVFDQDLSKWNTANVTDMNSMFSGVPKSQFDLSGWNVDKVTSYVAFAPNLPSAYLPAKFR